MRADDRATPGAVQRLRTRSGSGVVDCAWALRSTFTEEQAAGLLRLKGNAVATKPGHPDPVVRYLRDLVPPPELPAPDSRSDAHGGSVAEALRPRVDFWIAEVERLELALAERERDFQHAHTERVRAEESLFHVRADAARWRFVRGRAEWVRRSVDVSWDDATDAPVSEQRTYLQVRVPNGADLSCAPMVDDAVDVAMRAGQGQGGRVSPSEAEVPRAWREEDGVARGGGDEAFGRALDERLRRVDDATIRRAIRYSALGPYLDVEDLRMIVLGRRAEESIGARWAGEVLDAGRRSEVAGRVAAALLREPGVRDVAVAWGAPCEEADWRHVLGVTFFVAGGEGGLLCGLSVDAAVALSMKAHTVCASLLSLEERMRSEVRLDISQAGVGGAEEREEQKEQRRGDGEGEACGGTDVG